jgi:hypothetical protein
VFEHERRLAGVSGEQRDWIRMERDDKLGFIEGRLRTYCIDIQMQIFKKPQHSELTNGPKCFHFQVCITALK